MVINEFQCSFTPLILSSALATSELPARMNLYNLVCANYDFNPSYSVVDDFKISLGNLDEHLPSKYFSDFALTINKHLLENTECTSFETIDFSDFDSFESIHVLF